MLGAVRRAFGTSCTQVLCVAHLKRNAAFKAQSKGGMTDAQKHVQMKAIFDKETGLLSEKSEEAFNDRAAKLQAQFDKAWPPFGAYFRKTLLPKLQEYVHTPHLKHQGVHKVDWTNNNCESINRVIKQLTGWKPQRLIDLVLKLKENVSAQLKEVRSTLHDNGNFELVGPARRRLLHSAADWANLCKEARDRLFQKLLVY